MDRTPIGEYLQAECSRRGWSQEELARRSGVHASHLSRWSHGRQRVMSPSAIRAIARALAEHAGVTVEAAYLLRLHDVLEQAAA